ncbi:sensor domain-containing diguanylate cyclase/phosphohydrolase [Vallitalea sp.]|jgi:diguanylate cyclase (GGDEF)-like protein|uniref:sensor domain-containing diguanylate cyclase/phosphohydrolase n=1 Tax=Vallitalea sp. TaxID=1882829 RepID=UPI0025F9D4D9|nr:HD domain-containing phosphohydrolase [Vallitalea sp.]MCT4686465.1 diguanylate cyclase [Vallitalea sp.]
MNTANINEFISFILSHTQKLNSEKTYDKSEDSFFDNPLLVEMIQQIDYGILIVNNSNYLLFMNKAAMAALNLHKEDLHTKDMSLLFQHKNITSIKKIDDCNYHFTYSNNKTSTYDVTLNTLSNNNYLMITLKNITHVNNLQQELEVSKLKYNILVNNTPDILIRINKKGDITYFNCGLTKEIDIDPHKLINHNIFEVFPIDTAKQLKTTLVKVLHTKNPSSFKTNILINKKNYYFIIRIYPDINNHVMCLARDISEKISIKNKLEYLNVYDPLTGLFNRAYFENKLEYYNDPAFLPMGLVICDLNSLKLVNDTLGHSFGDTIIKESANIIQSPLSSYEEACRIGGDEFAIFFPNCSKSLLEKYKTTLLEGLERYNLSNPKLPLSFSIGYSLRETIDTDMETIFIAADNNMYHEKLLQGIKNRNNIVQGLIKSLSSKEYKNEDTKQFLLDNVVKLAKAVNYPEHNLDHLKLFVNFHDLGQVSIPNKILYKTEPLTTEELNIIKRHSEVGYKISLSIPNLFHIADLILKHHEWWNGEGYPLNIKGNNIPLECRIFSIVESYTAMITNNPYKDTISREAAVDELKRCAGKQFDPFIVDKFIEIIKEELDS